MQPPPQNGFKFATKLGEVGNLSAGRVLAEVFYGERVLFLSVIWWWLLCIIWRWLLGAGLFVLPLFVQRLLGDWLEERSH
jgi:hypothetical protein